MDCIVHGVAKSRTRHEMIMSKRIIPTILEGWRFLGIGPRPTFWKPSKIGHRFRINPFHR